MMNNPLVVSDKLVDFVASCEGTVLRPYLCPANVWTIGTGSTRDLNGKPVTASTPAVTTPQARQMLKRDLAVAAGGVGRLVKVALTQGHFDGLVSFTHNLGEGNLKASSLLRKLNAMDFKGAADEFPKWNMGGGKVLPGLVKRRAGERAFFLS